MKNKVIATLLATTIICGTFATLAYVIDIKENNNTREVVTPKQITPLDLSIDNGESNSNVGLEKTYKLNNDNGKYVNLYVENKGTNDVVATINDSSEKTLKPNEKGNVCVEVNQGFFGRDKDYVFKVLTGRNGGTVDIYYEIAQQENQ